MGLNTDIDYPWIPRKATHTAKFSDLLVSIYKMKLRKIFHYKRIALLPWFILAKIRFKFSWYSYLYDFYVLSKIHKIYIKNRGRIIQQRPGL